MPLLGLITVGIRVRVFVPDDVSPCRSRGAATRRTSISGARGARRSSGRCATSSASRDRGDRSAWRARAGRPRCGCGSPSRTGTVREYLLHHHLRADRWYRVGRTILYGQLEDEIPFGSVRRLVLFEDYALRLLRDVGSASPARTASSSSPRTASTCSSPSSSSTRRRSATPRSTRRDRRGDGWCTALGLGLAHRDIKPANLLVNDGHLQLVDVSGLEIRPTPWRQAVDLANMMLTLALRRDADRVYARASRLLARRGRRGVRRRRGSRSPRRSGAAEGGPPLAPGAVQELAPDSYPLGPAVGRRGAGLSPWPRSSARFTLAAMMFTTLAVGLD